MQYDNQLLQLFTSSLFIAGLLSSLVASYTTTRWGRRATMLMAGVAFCLGAALTAGAVHLAMLVVGRIMLGVGVGFANQARIVSYLEQGQRYVGFNHPSGPSGKQGKLRESTFKA